MSPKYYKATGPNGEPVKVTVPEPEPDPSGFMAWAQGERRIAEPALRAARLNIQKLERLFPTAFSAGHAYGILSAIREDLETYERLLREGAKRAAAARERR